MSAKTALVLGLLVTTLGVTGCGGSGGSGNDQVASVSKPGATASSSGEPRSQSDRDNALSFTRCMRSHGVNLPDPTPGPGGWLSDLNVPDGSDPKKVDAAMQACKRYLPNGGEQQKVDPQRLEQLRKLAACIREHGVPTFPDPTDQGIQVNGNEHPELAPDNPKVAAAQKACDKYAPAPAGEDGGPRTNTRTGA